MRQVGNSIPFEIGSLPRPPWPSSNPDIATEAVADAGALGAVVSRP